MNHHQGDQPHGNPVVMVNVVVESVSGAEVAAAGLAVVTTDDLPVMVIDNVMSVVMSASVAVRAVTPSVPIVSAVVASTVSVVSVTQGNPKRGMSARRMPAVAVSVGPVPTISAPVVTVDTALSCGRGKRSRHQESCDDGKSNPSGGAPFFCPKARGSRAHTRLFSPLEVACHVEPSFGSPIR